ncbi:MAG: methyltransferase domain-containing protein [Alphaproteobacteria bacterium]|jgi:NADH dehydrogenase [ubiquinone] 1 alpha subcomplex assembly factor 5|nr:methyltransferase domain-containing protein [Alphaproteobacteria bacterium]
MGIPSPLTNVPGLLFDRVLLKSRRNRASLKFSQHAFLKNRIGQDLGNRLKLIRRTFPVVVDLGGHTGQLASILPNALISTDLSEAMVCHSPSPLKVVLDEEALPFAKHAIDLIISALSLHWVNDFPGFLAQAFHCLKPDGLFLVSLFGGETLIELRDCFYSAELELHGGVSPRLSPMISVKEAGALLQRAGFALPVVDHDRIQVTYPHPLALLHDLRNMGETNILYQRSKAPLSRRLLMRMVELYQERYGVADGRVKATFDVVTLTGWVPHASQQTPLKRGSAKALLQDHI